jgi:hypothetical protein
VLVVLPTGDANVLKKQKEQQKMQALATGRSRQAFGELKAVSPEKTQ